MNRDFITTDYFADRVFMFRNNGGLFFPNDLINLHVCTFESFLLDEEWMECIYGLRVPFQP